MLQQMTCRALTPNDISYNAAISACEKGKQWEEALRLLQQMSLQGACYPTRSATAQPLALASGASTGVEALRLLQQMTCRTLTDDEISCSAAISGCEKGTQWEGSPAIAAADDLQGA